MSDVCLVLEGTYPYVLGGVSSWVHNLIRAMPRIRFSLLCILPSRSSFYEMKYEVPDNVSSISEVYIHDRGLSGRSAPATRAARRRAFEALERYYAGPEEEVATLLPEIDRLMFDPRTRVVSPEELFHSREAWDLLVSLYRRGGIEESFIDYFWTVRFSHMPLLRLSDAALPRAGLYHAVSTGYAGFIASIASMRTGAPLILTEHGIYTNERRIEIEQARWIYERRVESAVIAQKISPFKDLWISLFNRLSRITYSQASEIVTLFENNRRLQVRDGADPARTRIIPNGINLARFARRTSEPVNGAAPRIGFVGRVVPIKDVKTFIRAAKIVRARIPGAVFPVMGPLDEDPGYVEECRDLARIMGLEEAVPFLGRVDAAAAYPSLDMVVLTSVSEAQPLSILEANACGVPCVATDVGACAELIDGRGAEDRAIGPGGLVTPISDPEATAAAVLRLLDDPGLRLRMGSAGAERVRRFYDESDLNFAYLDLYRRHLGASRRRRSS